MATLTAPADGLEIRRNTRLKPGLYHLPNGISIVASGVELDGQGAILVGTGDSGQGISVAGVEDVTIRNVRLMGYYHAIHARDCQQLAIHHCRASATAETPPNSVFLDIWKPAEAAYGGGIFLQRVMSARVEDNDLQHQMNGLLAYQCRELQVERNVANYCSGFGYYLNETGESRFVDNFADFCCRYQPREGTAGHLGADAAGFVIVNGSCRNEFRGNMARLSGDGFFLAGLRPDGVHAGCDENLFVENDGSYSPNIAFEGTFSAGNVYRSNKASQCNYGFWLGFSAGCTLERNVMAGNRQAGVAVENGVDMKVRENQFYHNGHGVLLWSKYVAGFARAVPENDTSRDWTITRNQFVGNGTAIRIAADQDHGIRLVPAGTRTTPPPRNHVITGNRLVDNHLEFDLQGVLDSVVETKEMEGDE